MDPARWERIKAVFQDVFERAPAERSVALDALCGSDDDLRSAVEGLLASHESAQDFLQSPPHADVGALNDSEVEQVVPARIGPYRIVRKLGHGGMGAVFLAEREDPDLRKTVAIKVVRAASEFMVRRFRTEMQILSGLEHPGIARLYDGGTTDDGLPYFVMEYVSGGENLLAYCDARSLSLTERLRLFRRVCDAVQYAHQSLIVHRDLKPSNILVTPDGDPKLLDFGIAKLLSPQVGGGTAEDTSLFGRILTPQYASPEQVRGQTVTTASDVYSLGVLLYQLVSGRPPYRITSRLPAEIERAVCDEEPDAPSSAIVLRKQRRQMRGDLDNIVLKALRKNPHDRYATAFEFSEDLRRYLEGFPVSAQPDRRGYRAIKFVRRHRAGAAAGSIAILALMIGLGVALWQAGVARAERDRARAETAKAQRIASFLSDIFQGANPVQSPGQTVTARDLLDRATASIETELTGDAEIQASLLLVMADAYDRLAAFEKGLELAERSLALRREVLPAQRIEIAESLHAVGRALRRLGQSARAVSYLEQALVLREKLLGPNDLLVAQSLGELAIAQGSLGQTDGIRGMLERAIDIVSRASPASVRLADLYNDLGQHFYDRRDFPKARAAYEQSIAVFETSSEPDHWLIGAPLVNLGEVLRRQGEVVAARPFLERALAIDERTFGKDSQAVAYVLADLGDLTREAGDLAGAQVLLERSLAMYARTVPPDYVEIAAPATYLGRTLLAEGKPVEAIPVLERALRISEKGHGLDHADVADVLVELARARAALNRQDVGEPLLQRALAIQRRLLTADDPSLVPTLTLLGEAVASHDVDKGHALLDEALAIARAHLPEEHSQRVAVEAALRELSRSAPRPTP